MKLHEHFYPFLAGPTWWAIAGQRIRATKKRPAPGKSRTKYTEYERAMRRNMKLRNEIRLELANLLLRLQQRLETKAERSIRGSCPCCGNTLTLHETGIFRCDACRYDKDGKVRD